jgi:hypothetical protein
MDLRTVSNNRFEIPITLPAFKSTKAGFRRTHLRNGVIESSTISTCWSAPALAACQSRER